MSDNLFLKQWTRPYYGTVRAIRVRYRDPTTAYFTLADSVGFYVYIWDDGPRSTDWILVASTPQPHTEENPTVHSIISIQKSYWFIYTLSYSYYIYEFDPVNGNFNVPTSMGTNDTKYRAQFWFGKLINTDHIFGFWQNTWSRHNLLDLKRKETLTLADRRINPINTGYCIYHGSGTNLSCS